EADAVSLSEAWAASWWITAAGCLTFGAAYEFAPDLVFWVALIAAPAIVAPLLIHLTSTPASGRALARMRLLLTPQEQQPSPLVRAQEALLERWRTESTLSGGEEAAVPIGEDPAVATAGRAR